MGALRLVYLPAVVEPLAPLADDLAGAQAIMQAQDADVIQEQIIPSLHQFEQTFHLESIPLPQVSDPEACAACFESITKPMFSIAIRTRFDERIARHANAIRTEPALVRFTGELPAAVASGIVGRDAADAFMLSALRAVEEKLDGLKAPYNITHSLIGHGMLGAITASLLLAVANHNVLWAASSLGIGAVLALARIMTDRSARRIVKANEQPRLLLNLMHASIAQSREQLSSSKPA